MKLRTCFVSNSSSSSFIVSMDRPNGIDERHAVKIEHLKDQIRDYEGFLKSNPDDPDYARWFKEYRLKLEQYEAQAKEENSYIFDLDVEYGAEDIIEQLEGILPGFKVIERTD